MTHVSARLATASATYAASRARLYPFNDLSRAVFGYRYVDLDGNRVSDDAGYRFVVECVGRTARKWPLSRKLEFVAYFNSDEIALVLGIN